MTEMDGSDHGPDENTFNLFREPPDYYQPKKPFTFTNFELADGRSVPLRLVGDSPLWAHHLWNGAKTISDFLQANADSLVKGRNVLEFGAGAGLPSLVCALAGARSVIVTDYPDPELIENLQYNIDNCPYIQQDTNGLEPKNITAQGFLWGADVEPLIEQLASFNLVPSEDVNHSASPRFDTLILADILYSHSEHHKLIASVRATLARTRNARAIVFFTPYRPWLSQRDFRFFDHVNDAWTYPADSGEVPHPLGVEKIYEKILPQVMFENDPGDETVRRTVFGFEIFWADLQ